MDGLNLDYNVILERIVITMGHWNVVTIAAFSLEPSLHNDFRLRRERFPPIDSAK